LLGTEYLDLYEACADFYHAVAAVDNITFGSK